MNSIMAVTQSLLKRTLQLKVKTGVDASNKDVFKVLSFGNVKTNATPDAIFNVAASFGGLLGAPVSDILVADTSDLVNA